MTDAAFHALMQDATRLTQAGRLAEATAAIQRALRSPTQEGEATSDAADVDAMVIDGCVFEVHDIDRPVPPLPCTGFEPGPTLADGFRPAPAGEAPPRAATQAAPGRFDRGHFEYGSLKLPYKLYTPPGHEGRTLPLVVMLHGCTQSADDFAAGTAMNELAREQGFFVLYPEQGAKANPQRCWNWFKPNHQTRGRGEPAAIAALTQQVMRERGIDTRRVYIAGLSAGGAMAHIVALAYPEVFAAVGVHSGLACGAAGNVSEALAAMKSGAAPSGPLRTAARPQATVPTIVFHGDRDATVHPRNGEQVIAASLSPRPSAEGLDASSEQGVSRHGKPWTRSITRDARGKAVAEHWVVHGAGHAWSGGSAAGSYTDAQGPDASREMLRFFLDHPRA